MTDKKITAKDEEEGMRIIKEATEKYLNQGYKGVDIKTSQDKEDGSFVVDIIPLDEKDVLEFQERQKQQHTTTKDEKKKFEMKPLNEKASKLSFGGADVKEYRFFLEYNGDRIHLKKGSVVVDEDTGKQYLIDNEENQYIAKMWVDKSYFTAFQEAFVQYKDKGGKYYFDPKTQTMQQPKDVDISMIESFLFEEG
jgi:hypothetical protein